MCALALVFLNITYHSHLSHVLFDTEFLQGFEAFNFKPVKFNKKVIQSPNFPIVTIDLLSLLLVSLLDHFPTLPKSISG